MDTDTAYENAVVLYLVQALIGLVPSTMLAVSVEVGSDSITVHVAVREHSSELDEDISDILFELEALFTEVHPPLAANIHVGPPGLDWPGRGRDCRRVYQAKDAV